jgi:hypothetical protein
MNRRSFVAPGYAACSDTPPEQRGRVVHDPRGNAVWDWAIATGVLAKATTAQLLQSLGDTTVLALEGEAIDGWSGDPYNRC